MVGADRRLVVAFGYQLGTCGWAATLDVVNYEIRRRLGEWESSFVNSAGRLQQVIVTQSPDEAARLRDHLNAALTPEVRALVEKRGLSRPKIELLRDILETAFRLSEAAPHQKDVLRQLAWATVDAHEGAVWHVRRRLDELVNPACRPPRWDDTDVFPFAAVLFDLDQTLVDSSLLATAEDRRAWARKADPQSVRPLGAAGSIEPHRLPGLLAERNVKVALVTRSPFEYAQRVRSLFDIHADVVRAGPGDKAAKIRSAAATLGVALERTVIVGDDESDIEAARDVGASSVGALWAPKRWPDRLQPDITCRQPELLLRVADWRRLGFLGELPLELEPHVHTGSWIAYGVPQRHALGRYFTKKSVSRHSDRLTQTILAHKNSDQADHAIARALTLLGERVRNHAAIDLITSIPPAAGGLDRFSSYRQIAAAAFEAQSAQTLRMTREIPGYKDLKHDIRRKQSVGRFRADRAVDGMRLLVLDDVTTSGATFTAAEAALREAGAAEVRCLSFGATQD